MRNINWYSKKRRQKMNVVKTEKNIDIILVDVKALSKMLGIGVTKAKNIGEDAGALVQLGKRRLYNVEKVKEYVYSIAK